MTTLIPNAPQCGYYSSMKENKSQGQLITDHHVATQVEGLVSMGMRLSEIDPCSFDTNLSLDDYRDTSVGASGQVGMYSNSGLRN